LRLAVIGAPLLHPNRHLAAGSEGASHDRGWTVERLVLMLVVLGSALFMQANRAVAGNGGMDSTHLSTPPTQVRTTNSFRRIDAINPKIASLAGEKSIRSNLERIKVGTLKYDRAPFDKVIEALGEISRTQDPGHNGINFLWNPKVLLPSQSPSFLAAISVGKVTADSILITINPPLNNLRLIDALDAIIRNAEPPIEYSVIDYAVVFRLGSTHSFETRFYQLDPDTFRQGLEGVGGVPFGNSSGGRGGSGGSGQPTTVVPQVQTSSSLPGSTSAGGNPANSGSLPSAR
jgi:hypothetical protein